MSNDINIYDASETPRRGGGSSWSSEQMQQAIHAYVNGKMSEQEEEQFWEELIEQPAYFDYLRLEASLKKLHEQKKGHLFSGPDTEDPPTENEPPAKSGFSGYLSWMVAAAAVAALVISVNILRVSGPLGERAEPAPMASADAITPPLASIDVLYFESIDAFRDEASSEAFTQLFDEALLAAFSNNDEKALRIYDELLQNFPDDERTAMVQLNAGIIYYNNEDYAAAEQRFENALRLAELHNDFMLQEKALWFKANAQLYGGHIAAASKTLEQTIDFQGSFESDAREALNMIRPYLDE
ncbi:MAG: tetratricopeptide repeat protein [Cyclonatronaceae bacterium]